MVAVMIMVISMMFKVTPEMVVVIKMKMRKVQMSAFDLNRISCEGLTN